MTYPLGYVDGNAIPPTDLASVVLVLEHRAAKLSECLSAQLEADYPLTYERIYWLVCGIGDYLSAFKQPDFCGNAVRHGRHEYLQGVRRVDCPGAGNSQPEPRE